MTTICDERRHGLLSLGYRPCESQTNFFQPILLSGCTTWILTKRMKKKLDGNCPRMLRAILNKSYAQHPTKQQQYGHLPPISETTEMKRTRHTRHCWRSKDELKSDVRPWTPSHGRASVGWPTRIYQQRLSTDTGCSLEDQLEASDDSGE